MPCYTVTPAYRRNLVHYNPFFHGSPQGPLTTTYPRYSSPSFLQSFQEDLAQFDNFFREVDENLSAIRKSQRSFQPKFDIHEENGTFVLTGELPGVKAEDLKVEFVAKNTLLVEGRIVREETHGEPSGTSTEKAAIESAPTPAEAEPVQDQDAADEVTMSGALPEQASDAASITTSTTTNYHKASVEDENPGEAPASEHQQQQQQIVQPTPEQDIPKNASTLEKKEPSNSHYWVSERTVGEFRRVFRFPGKVDQDAVKATLKDGILTVAVPKVAEREGNRRIQVDA